MNLNVDIDVTQTKLDYYGLDSDHRVLFPDEVSNHSSNIKAIKPAILKAKQQQKLDEVIIGTEAKSVYL